MTQSNALGFLLKPTFPTLTVRNKSLDQGVSFFITIVSMVFVFFVPFLLNRTPGGDALTLLDAYSRMDGCNMWGPITESRGSYPCTALILNSVGVDFNNAWLYGGVVNIMLTFIPVLLFKKISLSMFLINCGWGVVRALFLVNLSKELIVGFVVAFILFLVLCKKPKFGWIFGASLYGFTTRAYWLLCLLVWAGLEFFKNRLSPVKMIFGVFATYFILSITFIAVLGFTVSSIRLNTNDGRILGEEGARTLIVPFLSSENFIVQTFDLFLTFFRLAFPIELLVLSPGISQLVVVIIMPITFFWMAKFLISRPSNGDGDKFFNDAKSMISIPFCFLIIQGLFEPDYGSFIRHFSMLAPLLFVGYGMLSKSKAISVYGK